MGAQKPERQTKKVFKPLCFRCKGIRYIER